MERWHKHCCYHIVVISGHFKATNNVLLTLCASEVTNSVPSPFGVGIIAMLTWRFKQRYLDTLTEHPVHECWSWNLIDLTLTMLNRNSLTHSCCLFVQIYKHWRTVCFPLWFQMWSSSSSFLVLANYILLCHTQKSSLLLSKILQ